MNLWLDDFDDDYIERASSTTCPDCGLKTPVGTLLSRRDNGRYTLEFQVVSKPVPVIFCRERPLSEQPETVKWIKEWIAPKGREGIVELDGILSRMRIGHPPPPYDIELLCELMEESADPSTPNKKKRRLDGLDTRRTR